MEKQILNFKILSDTEIGWICDNKEVNLSFTHPVRCYHIQHRDEVVVVGDTNEFGPKNLIVYSADGTVRARPKMPVLDKPVEGVYSVWFVEGKDKQNTILLSDNYAPYDTGCIVDFSTCEFSDFHPAK